MTQDTGADSSTKPSANFLAGESRETVENALTDKNPHVFRVAQAQLDGSPTPSVRVNSRTERTLEDLVSLEPTYLQHEAVTGIPFAASYYSLDKVYGSLEAKEQNYIRSIDDYIGKQIKSGKFNDSAEAATQIIKDLETKLKLSDNNDPYYRVERISKYLSAMAAYNKQSTAKARIVKEVAKQPTEVERVARSAVTTVKKLSQSAMEQVSQLREDLSRKELKTGEKIIQEVTKTTNQHVDQIKQELAEIRGNQDTVKQKDYHISKLLSVNEKLIKDKEGLRHELQNEKERFRQQENEIRKNAELDAVRKHNNDLMTAQNKLKLALAKITRGLL